MPTELTGRVVTAEREFPAARLSFSAAGIIDVAPLDPALAPPAGQLPTIVPGFVDLHNHGGGHGAFPTGSPADCRRAARFHRLRGTTTLLASLVSGTEEELTRQVGVLGELVEEGLIAGIHLEGPFINAVRCGAQSPDRIKPGDPEMLVRILETSPGAVRQITLAPETRRLVELLEVCARYDVIASFGHTDADFDTTAAALHAAEELGATVTATHLFNAMTPLHHRAPGAAGALLHSAAEGAVSAELVADGVHLSDGTVDLVTAVAGDRAFAVTDAIEAAGMPDGDYTLGPLDVVVEDAVARLREPGGPGAIAGGTSSLVHQFRRFRRRHDGPAAVRLTATNAAAVLGLGAEVGDLRPGLRANLVVLTPSGGVAAVYVDGAPVSSG